jgi:hypothetical protein
VAARGNVTSFALPWQDIMAELGRLERTDKAEETSDLPHTGEQLSSMVQVLLKVSDATTKDNLPKFIHQARVRRRVVLHQLRKMKDRGHRAYVKLDLRKAEEKASAFDSSEDGAVPPEIVKLLPHDTHLDKMMPQKIHPSGRSSIDRRESWGEYGPASAQLRHNGKIQPQRR